MKRRITTFLALVIIVTLALPQIVWAADGKDNMYRFQTRILPYSAQMENEMSVRVTWYRLMDCKAFILSWKRAGSDEKAQSVRIDNPKTESYVVTDLEPKTDYIFNIKGILTGADGKDLFTEGYDIEGATYLKTPEYAISILRGKSISSYWHVREQYSCLKVYRSETKNGSYKRIKTLEAGGNYGDDVSDFAMMEAPYVRFLCSDNNVEKGKTYYYKAQAEGTVAGKTYSSEMSEPVALAGRNEEGHFYTKLLNKRNTYTKQIKIKLTSDKANYITYLKELEALYYYRDNWKRNKRIVKKTEYSRDGKKYYALKNKNVKIKAGQSVYLRITTKSRYWLGYKRGAMVFNVKYCRPAYVGKVDHAKLEIGRFDSQGETNIGGIIYAYEEERDPTPEPFADIIRGSYTQQTYPKAKKISDTSVMLEWPSVKSFCPYNGSDTSINGYEIRYGTTKKSITIFQNKPVIVPKYQVQFLIDGLKKGKTYYFSVIPFDDNGRVEEESLVLKWNWKTHTWYMQKNFDDKL